MTRFSINFNKSSAANLIEWTSTININECEPFIDFIRCDDGEDFVFLTSKDKQFKTIGVSNFEAVNSNEDNRFYICLEAAIDVNLENHKKFSKALEVSNYMIEVAIGFRLGKKNLDCFEEIENKQVLLEAL